MIESYGCSRVNLGKIYVKVLHSFIVDFETFLYYMVVESCLIAVRLIVVRYLLLLSPKACLLCCCYCSYMNYVEVQLASYDQFISEVLEFIPEDSTTETMLVKVISFRRY